MAVVRTLTERGGACWHRASLTWTTGRPDELPGCSKRRVNMSTISMMRTGHHRLADGSLLRVDIERGRWVGSLYTRDMRVKTRVVGSDVEVHGWACRVQQRNKPAS